MEVESNLYRILCLTIEMSGMTIGCLKLYAWALDFKVAINQSVEHYKKSVGVPFNIECIALMNL